MEKCKQLIAFLIAIILFGCFVFICGSLVLMLVIMGFDSGRASIGTILFVVILIAVYVFGLVKVARHLFLPVFRNNIKNKVKKIERKKKS